MTYSFFIHLIDMSLFTCTNFIQDFFLENVSLYLYCSKSIKIIKSSFFSPTAKIKFHVEIFFYECMTLKTSKLLILYLTSIRTISFIKSLLQWHSPVTLNLRLPSVCSFLEKKNQTSLSNCFSIHLYLTVTS